jgi:hypothetical protein
MDGATGKPIGGATVSFWSFDSHDPGHTSRAC